MAAATKKKAPAKAAAPKAAAKPKARKAPAKPTHKQGAGAAAPAPAGNSREQSGEVRIPLDDIAPSPLNPRKTFTEESIAELAGSLAAVGQLQNVTLRKVSDKSPRYHLIMGERRFRAMKLLATDGRWPSNAPVRALIMSVDDATHLELAIEENERREDVHPLEQAEAYARLAAIREKETGDEAAAATLIAERTGQSRRNIQYYLQCARHLTPEMKEAWTNGWIPTRKLAIACARFPRELQSGIIDALEWGDIRTEADLKDWLAGAGYSAEFAVFNIEDYTAAGGTITEADAASVSGPTLLDKALFLKLQGKAVEAKAKELTTLHKLKLKPQKFAQYYQREEGVKIVDGAKTMPDDAFVLYGLHPHTAEAWIHVVSPSAKKPVKAAAAKPAKGGSGDAGAAEPEPQEYARKNWLAGAKVRTEALRHMIAATPDIALALTIVSLVPTRAGTGYCTRLVDLREPNLCGDAKEVASAATGLDPSLFNGIDGFAAEPRGWVVADREVATSALLKLPPGRLLDLFASVIASFAVDMQGYSAGPGATREAVALGKWARIERTSFTPAINEALSLQACTGTEWFKAYTTSQLLAIAEATQAADAMRAAGSPPSANKSYMVSQMADYCPQDWVPPEAQFLDRDAMTAAVETLLQGGKS